MSISVCFRDEKVRQRDFIAELVLEPAARYGEVTGSTTLSHREYGDSTLSRRTSDSLAGELQRNRTVEGRGPERPVTEKTGPGHEKAHIKNPINSRQN